MNPITHGRADGQPLFYFHGVPSAAVEAAMLRTANTVTRCTEQAHDSCLLENAEAMMKAVQLNA